MTATSLSLTGRVVVVTGAGAGLGRATAIALARAGAEVFGVSHLPDELESLGHETAREGLAVHPVRADVSDVERAPEVIGDVLARAKRIDALVNNAGIIIQRMLEETTPEAWERVIEVNLRGPYLYSRAVVPAMRAAGCGVIVNVSSRAGVYGFATQTAYCAAKFGLEGFTRSLALELRDAGVAAVTVTPGHPMNTPMSHTTYSEEVRRIWKDPAELAPGMVVLVRDGTPAMSGARFELWRLAQEGLPADLASYTADMEPPTPAYLSGIE